MPKKVYLFILGLFTFFLFTLFSFLVAKDVFTQFDFDTSVRIQDKVSDRLSELLSAFSLLGSIEVITVIFLVALFISRKFIKRILVLPFYFFLTLTGVLGKIFLTHPGPPFMFYHYKINFVFPSAYVNTGNSYPSGHAARTVFVSIILMAIVLKNKKLSPQMKFLLCTILLAIDALMLLSRVYLGEHWTTDVLGGALLGVSFGIIATLFL